MNVVERIWHAVAGDKNSLIKAMTHVADQLGSGHLQTDASFQLAFQPSSDKEHQSMKSEIKDALQRSIETIKTQDFAKPEHFECHDQIGSLAQSTLNEHLTALNINNPSLSDDLDSAYSKYSEADLVGWVPVFLKILAEKFHLQHKAAFLFGDSDDDDLFVHNMPSTCKVILVADWGADSSHAKTIGERIKVEISSTNIPVFMIHLGDIYYSGSISECRAFIRNWPLRDSKTDGPLVGNSFALNGNHEMYSGGDGYFGTVLPTFKQKASYFLLRNSTWNFFGLDTAYVGGKLHDKNDARLENQWNWLKRQMDTSPQRKHIFLSHNQPVSANREEHEAGKGLRENLAELQEGNLRPLYGWFFGHQHKCYIYEDDRIPYKARLIGNGCFPHDIQTEKYTDKDELGQDLMRFAQLEYKGFPGGLAYSGYVSIDVNEQMLYIRYIDEFGNTFHKEDWSAH